MADREPEPATGAIEPQEQSGNGATRRPAPGHEPYYIKASSAIADEQRRVLKQGESFAVFDHYGDIKPVGLGEEGLYHEGTRYLSCMLLRLGPDRPLFLSSTVKEDNALLAVDLTNPDFHVNHRMRVPRGMLHVFRAKFLWAGVCHERIVIRNYGMGPVRTPLSVTFEADFADIFEVRGTHRQRRGVMREPQLTRTQVVLAYEGLDCVERRTRIRFMPAPDRLSEMSAEWECMLPAGGEMTIGIATACERGEETLDHGTFSEALEESENRFRREREGVPELSTSNDQFNGWLNRTAADLQMMTTDTSLGPYPYGGVPWFCTVFGRDGILTALEMLWMEPRIARGVLLFLAATQADAVKPEQDAEPGKILHEMRQGEMAALGEIPFGRYYGSVDSTPLFVALAGAYHRRTGDRALIERLWPNIERALEWIDTYGDCDGDGFVEYARQTDRGLVQQGWKDSSDSVFHSDGTLADAPIALCEVQGYVYLAFRMAAEMASALRLPERATALARQAEELRARFERAFWSERLSTYAIALDGQKRQCRVRTSNAGQVLFTGIASEEHARRVADTLVSPDSFSGWGVRTLSSNELRYNPMSYHNGSIWPHDNALIAAGLARYRMKHAAVKILSGLSDASQFMDLNRMPELFCGFSRRPGEGPTLYPVACAPQSWAAASVYMLLQACLGLEVDGLNGRIAFTHPLLPAFLNEVRIHNLRVGGASVDLLVRRHETDVGLNVLRRTGEVEITLVK